jgi:hypothetical protein
MLKRLFCGDSFSGIIDKDLLKEVEEVSAELVVVWYDFLFHLLASMIVHGDCRDLHPTVS